MDFIDAEPHALCVHSLNMWANYIETGDPVLNQIDAINMRQSIKPLSREQVKLVIRLRDLADKLGNTKNE